MAPPSLFSLPVPGTLIADRQAPFVSLTRNAWWAPEASMYHPPATQLRAKAHDTSKTSASPPVFSAPLPGTSIAARQAPCRSLTTKACRLREPPLYDPPAAQPPAGAHDTESTRANPPLFSAPVPGTSIAGRQTPARWVATNAC